MTDSIPLSRRKSTFNPFFPSTIALMRKGARCYLDPHVGPAACQAPRKDTCLPLGYLGSRINSFSHPPRNSFSFSLVAHTTMNQIQRLRPLNSSTDEVRAPIFGARC